MHGGVNAAGVRWLTWKAEVAIRVPIGQVRFGVQAANRVGGNGGEFALALGAFGQSWSKRVLLPSLFFFRGLALFLRWFRRHGLGIAAKRVTHGNQLPGASLPWRD